MGAQASVPGQHLAWLARQQGQWQLRVAGVLMVSGDPKTVLDIYCQSVHDLFPCCYLEQFHPQ